MERLIDEVLRWWKEHQYDCSSDREDERNLYDEEPEFVSLAKELRNIKRKGKGQ